MISINVLEFLVVVISYAAAYTVVTTEQVTDDPCPIVLNVTDNMSALNWMQWIDVLQDSSAVCLLDLLWASIQNGSQYYKTRLLMRYHV